MLSLLAATAVAAGQPSADPDVRCMAAYLVVAGQMGDDPASSAEDQSGVSSIIMYFFGKIRGRSPTIDVKQAVMTLVQSQGYLEKGLETDIKRCSTEAEVRGKELGDFASSSAPAR